MTASQTGAGMPAGSKRFYETAGTEEAEGGFVLTLDGRRARTPARARLALPTRPLAEAVADEWQRQGPVIDPHAMPLTKLANSAIDGVANETDAVRDDLVRYAGSDLVMYRAGEPDTLVAAQSEAWDPVLAWAHEELGARFILSEGVMFVAQPEGAIAAVRASLAGEVSPFRLAPLHVMTTLTGSVLISLMHAGGRLDGETAWRAAHADELFQESRWGIDDEAARRREARRAEFEAASLFFALAGRS